MAILLTQYRRIIGTGALLLSLLSLQLYVNSSRLRRATLPIDTRRRIAQEDAALEQQHFGSTHQYSSTRQLPPTTPAPLSSAAASRPLCTSDQLQDGSWLPVTLDRPPYISKTKHLQCHGRTLNNYYANHSYDTYAWTPMANCSFTATFNATEFCALTKYTTISIIGDSLSWEHYSSLLQMLGQRVHQLDQHRSKTNSRNHIQMACHAKIVYRNDARLEFLRDSMRSDFPTILILNRGAHYVNDTELVQGMHETIQTLQEWQAACRRLGLACHLYWRTSVPGHPNCIDATGPVNYLPQMRNFVNDPRNYDNTTMEYHWHDFDHQNQLVLDMLEHAGNNKSSNNDSGTATFNYTVLPAYHVNILRPDLHRTHQNDCLHNCYPGKMDVYSQMLLHFLKRERTPDIVDNHERQYREAYGRYQRQRQQLEPAATTARV